MNYIKMYENLIPKMDLDLVLKQKEGFLGAMRDGVHPQQRKIVSMLDERIKELS